MMTKKEKAKLQEKFEKASTPYDDKIKKVTKLINNINQAIQYCKALENNFIQCKDSINVEVIREMEIKLNRKLLSANAKKKLLEFKERNEKDNKDK